MVRFPNLILVPAATGAVPKTSIPNAETSLRSCTFAPTACVTIAETSLRSSTFAPRAWVTIPATSVSFKIAEPATCVITEDTDVVPDAADEE